MSVSAALNRASVDRSEKVAAFRRLARFGGPDARPTPAIGAKIA